MRTRPSRRSSALVAAFKIQLREGGPCMTTEIDRLKVLEGKIGLVIEHITRVTAENEKLQGPGQEPGVEKKDMEDLAKRAGKLTRTSKSRK
jgi:hypothetical protein